MDLTMVLQNDLNSGLMWCGMSGKKLGVLPPSECHILNLSVISMAPGLQVKHGISSDFQIKITEHKDQYVNVLCSLHCGFLTLTIAAIVSDS